MKTTRIVLIVRTHESGSHLTVYPNGTPNLDLVHDWDPDSGSPTRSAVVAEVVSAVVAEKIEGLSKEASLGSGKVEGIHFSTVEEWYAFEDTYDPTQLEYSHPV